MGTNYYWKPTPSPCPTCGHDDTKEIHIGKLSGGWRFSFHGTDKIRSWKDWRSFIARSSGVIEDEYGTQFTLSEFAEIVENSTGLSHRRYCLKSHPDYAKSLWEDDEGYSFSPGEFC